MKISKSIIVLGMLFTLSACGGKKPPEQEVVTIPTIESVVITDTKLNYVEGDKLNTSTLLFKLFYSDATEKTIGYSELLTNELSLVLKDPSMSEVSLDAELNEGVYTLAVMNKGTSVGSLSFTVDSKEYPFIPGSEKLSDLTSTFTEKDGQYVADDYRAAKTLVNNFDNGTFQIEVSPKEFTYDHFVFFNYNDVTETYYSFGFNSYKKAQITYYDGTNLRLVKALYNVEINTKATLTISLDKETSSVDYWVDNNCVYSDNVTLNSSAKAGIYSGSKGSEFKNMVINSDSSFMDSKFENYGIAHGSGNVTNNGFEVTQDMTIAYHKSKEFVVGELEATFNAKDMTNNVGLAFCIDNNGSTTFFRETGVSYYYLYLSKQGTLYLSSVDGGSPVTLKSKNTPWFDINKEHTIKVVKDTKEIHVYFDGLYQMSYSGLHMFTGTKFAICTSGHGVTYSKVTTKNYASSNDNWKAKYDVSSGSWYGLGDLICAEKNKSMLLLKEQLPENGTLEAEISLGKNVGSGLVFRLTKPNTDSFYESEEGLSYYMVEFSEASRVRFGKFVNGTATWSILKYYPNFMNLAGKMKVVMNGNKINVYFDDRCIFEYIDEQPLTGKYAGFKSASKGASLSGDITFKNSTDLLTCEYLIFGHSYTQLWHNYKKDFAPLTSDILDIGIGGSQTGTFSNQYLNEVASYKARWGIYWNGVNDIDADISVETIMANMKKCLEGIKEINPNFKCAVLATSKCTHEKPMARMSQIESFNSNLKTYCESKDWLVYVDVQDIYCVNGQPQASYFVDNLHPTVEAYQMVAPLVIEAIRNADK